MRVLVTGGCGNVGQSTVKSLAGQGHAVRVFDMDTLRNRRIIRSFGPGIEGCRGNILHIEDVRRAVQGMDAVIHLAAVIPPLADKKPDLAELVNVDGTHNIVYAMEKQEPAPKLIFTSSVAVYGDRLNKPYIGKDDSPNPNEDDYYALQKLKGEEVIRASSLEWTIFRLSYIVDPKRLKLDPIMFDMPLDTSIEICDTRDVGVALASSITSEEISGKTLQIAGGHRCRVSYRRYLQSMLEIFGFGKTSLPETAFSNRGFHCGFMATDESQEKLNYQKHTLLDYYRDVRKRFVLQSFFLRFFRGPGRRFLLLKSPYFLRSLSERLGSGLSRGTIALRFLFSSGRRVF